MVSPLHQPPFLHRDFTVTTDILADATTEKKISDEAQHHL